MDNDTKISTIAKILEPQEREEFIETFKKNFNKAKKCIVIFGYPSKSDLEVEVLQFGFEYLYEIAGFSYGLDSYFDELKRE